jgi:hypothetical protein
MESFVDPPAQLFIFITHGLSQRMDNLALQPC